ncbi:MAG: hemolysin family protein [Cytophagaceae bacterium]|nr:hemolysin family protein [Cytophagaceae bacterium]
MSEILILLFLMVLNGVFSMSEIALVSARKSRLKHDAERGDSRARAAFKLAEHPDTFLSTVQVGITVIGILTGIFSGDALALPIRTWLEQFEPIRPYARPLALGLLLIGITYFSLVIGELVPKRIGLTRAESIAKAVALPMSILSRIAHPFIWLLSTSTSLVIKVLGIRKTDDSAVTEEEIKAIINEGMEQGTIDEIEQEIVENVFNVSDRNITSLMTTRSDLVWLDADATSDQYQAIVRAERHSIYPVCEGSIDRMVGVVSIKDLYVSPDEARPRDLMKKPLYVPENNSAYQILEKFRESRVHQGFIVDEYGTLQGMVTVNDIFEAIVGNVPDAEGEDYSFVKRDDGSYLVDAQMPFIDFLGRMDRDPREFLEEDFSTLAGFILHQLERIPQVGETFTWRDMRIEVVDMDDRRIDKVLVTEEDD